MSNKRVILYVGTFTRYAPFLANTSGEGIYVYEFDPETGGLHYLSEVNDVDSPSYINVDPHNRCLYAVNEIWGWDESIINAYAIDPDSGKLSYINKQPCQGALPCYVMVDQTNQYLVSANYESGSVVLFPIGENGRLHPLTDFHQHAGTGPNADRQEGPHAHSAVIDPTNRFVFVPDLGIDKVMSYRLDLENGKLIPNEVPFVELPPGSGPRHLTFHENGRFAYLISELNSTITALNYDAKQGTLSIIHTVSTLPADFDGESHCAEVRVSPSGKFLYGSNRGHDSLAIFAIDAESGRLTAVSHQSTLGKTPRNFNFDPSGRFLLAANQDSSTIVTFLIDQETGLLEPTGQVANVPTPVCLKMIVLDENDEHGEE